MFVIRVLLVVKNVKNKRGKLWNFTRFRVCNPTCFINHGVRSETSVIRTVAAWIMSFLLYQSRDIEVACAGQVRLWCTGLMHEQKGQFFVGITVLFIYSLLNDAVSNQTLVRAIAQAVSRRLRTAAVRVRGKVR